MIVQLQIFSACRKRCFKKCTTRVNQPTSIHTVFLIKYDCSRYDLIDFHVCVHMSYRTWPSMSSSASSSRSHADQQLHLFLSSDPLNHEQQLTIFYDVTKNINSPRKMDIKKKTRNMENGGTRYFHNFLFYSFWLHWLHCMCSVCEWVQLLKLSITG